jgi:hypothetical protein
MNRKAGSPAGLSFAPLSKGKRFIAHSPNKSDGTDNRAEHQSSRFVIGPGNAIT